MAESITAVERIVEPKLWIRMHLSWTGQLRNFQTDKGILISEMQGKLQT